MPPTLHLKKTELLYKDFFSKHLSNFISADGLSSNVQNCLIGKYLLDNYNKLTQEYNINKTDLSTWEFMTISGFVISCPEYEDIVLTGSCALTDIIPAIYGAMNNRNLILCLSNNNTYDKLTSHPFIKDNLSKNIKFIKSTELTINSRYIISRDKQILRQLIKLKHNKIYPSVQLLTLGNEATDSLMSPTSEIKFETSMPASSKEHGKIGGYWSGL